MVLVQGSFPGVVHHSRLSTVLKQSSHPVAANSFTTETGAIRFSGREAPSVRLERQNEDARLEQLANSHSGFLTRVIYERDGEYITGLDLLKAVNKAGYKALMNPFVTLNPIKWGQMLIAVCGGDGYSQWVGIQSITRNLPLKYNRRGEAEKAVLLEAVREALSRAESLELLHYDRAIGPPHVMPVWRPRALMHRLLSRGHSNSAGKVGALEQVEKEVNSSRLKTNFEQQIQQIERNRQKHLEDSAALDRRLQQEQKQLQEMKTALNREESSFTTRFPSTDSTGFDPTRAAELGRLKQLHARIDNKQELIDALKLQAEVATALSKKMAEDSSTAIAAIEKTLNRLEITRINTETLRMSGQLKEKAQADQKLADQLEEANLAYHKIKAALDAESPQVFIEMIRQLELGEAEAAAGNPLKELATQHKKHTQAK